MTQMNLVKCKACGEHKETTAFSKRTASPNGLQQKCKQCNKSDNLKFRNEKPEHHADWQKNNFSLVAEYLRKYRKADKTPKVYSITNPIGEIYYGATEMSVAVRMIEHRTHYRRACKGKRNRLGKLHDSFDLWGIENHKLEVIKELPNATRKQMFQLEKAYILIGKSNNNSLNIK